MAFGQVSDEEAAARLKAKEVARVAATSQPAAIAELIKLRSDLAKEAKENESLAKMVADLREQNASLQTQIDRLANPATKQVARKNPNWRDELKIGMTEVETDLVLQSVPQTKDYVVGKTTESLTAEGKSVKWMATINDYTRQESNSSRGVTVRNVPAGGHQKRICTITFEQGKVTAIDF